MTSERLLHIQEIFGNALEQVPSLRLVFVEQACSGDPELLAEVQKLLRAHEETGVLDDLFLPSAPEPVIPRLFGKLEGRRLGPYRIVREIGRGGMGIVYLANRADGAFRKHFALKILQANWATEDLIERFRREREILGSLEHPNIARLIDAGITEEDLPYYVMEYVEGKSIDSYCDEHHLNITQRIRLFCSVCEAVQYAHQNLIVHRDLKPSNILVTNAGTVKLLDFGIAKFLNERQQETVFALTQPGLRLMTPEYASPEQIRGEAITTATDIYALGVILYELLTGRRPYRLKKGLLHEVEHAICEEMPTRPSGVIAQEDQKTASSQTMAVLSALREGTPARLKRRLTGDLDNIVMMALRKEPYRRYPSAEQLGADLDRHLDSMPVIASKDTALYRTQKLLQRHKFPIAAAFVFLLFLIGSLLTTVRLYLNARHAELLAVQQASEARARQLAAEANYMYTQGGQLTLGSLLGLEAVIRNPLPENRRALVEILALAGRLRAVVTQPSQINAIAISSDGRWFVTAGQDGTARFYNTNTRQEQLLVRHQGSINAIALSSDNRWLATASDDRTARIWNTQTGQERSYMRHQGEVKAIAMSPDARWLATGDSDKTVRLWDIQNGREHAFFEHAKTVNALAFSPDGKYLVAAGNDKFACLWDVAKSHLYACFKHKAEVNTLAISPDGKWIATAGKDDVVRLWDLHTHKEVAWFQHHDLIFGIAISPDGKWLATADRNREAHIWDVQTGQEKARLEHQNSINAVSISADGTWLITGGNDRTVRIWDARTGSEHVRLQAPDTITAVTASPANDFWATASSDHRVCLWDARTGRKRICVEHGDESWSVAISPDVRWFASTSHDGTARIWDVQTGQEKMRLQHSASVDAVAISPTGKWLITACADGVARIWDAQTGQERLRMKHDGAVRSVAVSPDSSWVATTSNDNTVRIWDTKTGQQRFRMEEGNWVRSVAISPDGQWLATASIDGTARIWDARTGKERVRLDLPTSIRAVAISQDGQWLATAGHDNTVRIWSTRTNREFMRLSYNDNPEAIAFIRNNGLLVAHGETLSLGPWQTPDLLRDLCARLNRNFTRSEWRQYFGGEPYRRTCSNLPLEPDFEGKLHIARAVGR